MICQRSVKNSLLREKEVPAVPRRFCIAGRMVNHKALGDRRNNKEITHEVRWQGHDLVLLVWYAVTRLEATLTERYWCQEDS